MLYEWGERGDCASTMSAQRAWMTPLGWAAAFSFVLSLPIAARRPGAESSVGGDGAAARHDSVDVVDGFDGEQA